MNRTVLLILFISTILSFGNADADSLRCQNQIISPGDDQADVEGICGTPSFEDSYQEERTIKTFRLMHVVSRNPERQMDKTYKRHDHVKKDVPEVHESKDKYRLVNEQTFSVNFEEWTYNFGPSSFIRTLTFENGRLVSIKAGDYGFASNKDYDFEAKKGDSKAEVWLKYGPAEDIQKKVTYEISVSRRAEGDYLYEEKLARPMVEEEWTYDLGPDKYLRKLIFRHNLLVRIKTLRTKGKQR